MSINFIFWFSSEKEKKTILACSAQFTMLYNTAAALLKANHTQHPHQRDEKILSKTRQLPPKSIICSRIMGFTSTYISIHIFLPFWVFLHLRLHKLKIKNHVLHVHKFEIISNEPKTSQSMRRPRERRSIMTAR
jgi:hypothetical protein